MAISLASLKKGRELKPPMIMIYGTHGVGKSTLASESDAPVFLQTEEGLNSLDVTKTPKLNSVDEVYNWIGTLVKEDHPYRTCVIDTIDHFEGLVHKHVRETHGDTIFADYGKGYKFALPYFHKLIDGLTALRDRKNMTTLLLGHAKIFQFNSPDQPAYDRYAPDMHESVSNYLEECMDCVLFCNYKVYVTKEDVGFNKQEGKATGKGDRAMFTQERPPYRAKNRYWLDPELPMSYDALMRGIGSGLDKRIAHEAAVASKKVAEVEAPLVVQV